MKKIVYFFILASLFIPNISAYNQNELSAAEKLAGEGIIAEQENPLDYRLNDTITRKEFMKVIAKITKDTIEEKCEKKFTDVRSDDWGCKYIEWALRKEFIAANSNFRPDENITKAESMKLILKARGIERIESSDDWRQNDMTSANQSGIIEYLYYDYDTQATRGWIFEVSANEKGKYVPGRTQQKNDPNAVL